MKTPEQMAVEWLKEEYGDTSNWTYMGQEMSLDAFYAGYQSAQQWIMGVQEDLGNMTVTGIMLAKVVDYAAKHYPDDESEQNHIAQQSYLDGLLAGYQAAKDQLADADKVMPQWISVKERLPEEDVWVLGYYSIYENHIYDVGVVKRFVHTWAEANIWLTNHKSGPLTYEEIDSITYWQPLPAPPKEEK